MDIIKFPGAKGKKGRISDSDKCALIQEFADMLEHCDSLDELNFKCINRPLFQKYLLSFPCFQDYQKPLDPEELFELYEVSDQLTSQQELALLATLEIITLYDLGFGLSEAMQIWDPEHMAAFGQILAAHNILRQQ